jgi:hypothetical protein
MITKEDFIKKYGDNLNLYQFKKACLIEQSIDWDDFAGAQCVDLIRFYWHCVLKLDKQPAGVVGAKDFYLYPDKVLVDNFIKIRNDKDTIPKSGDIVIWDATSKNKYGHIGIVLEADIRSMKVLEQNYIKNIIGIRTDNYANCLGFLRKK